MKQKLTGITWGHSRGITPLLAVSQRMMELHHDLEITWQKRSLQEFADMPIEQLTAHYDLLVIDHPWVGTAAATGCVLPLDLYLDRGFLDNQSANTVGRSYESYGYDGHMWALPLDAATPVASYRPDLLKENEVPRSWDQLLALARRGRVLAPGIPIDVLMSFYTFCLVSGGVPFTNADRVVDHKAGVQALGTMKRLYDLLPQAVFDLNPIAVAETLSRSDDFWYCPFAYGYSNYARAGYSDRLLKYTDVVAIDGQQLPTTLGGTGLSVSACCESKGLALEFLCRAASEAIQKTVYVQHGGQPGHLEAWRDPLANQLTGNYFSDTLPALERAYLRPRYHGYLAFQDKAGDPLQDYLRSGGNPVHVLKELDRLYLQSRKI